MLRRVSIENCLRIEMGLKLPIAILPERTIKSNGLMSFQMTVSVLGLEYFGKGPCVKFVTCYKKLHIHGCTVKYM